LKEIHMATSAVSSSIDVNSIVSQLMQVESQPLTVLQSKEATILSTISAYGTVKGSLSSFQSAVSALSSPSLYTAQSANASDPTVLSASTSLLATGGNYDITVNSLAKSQKLSSAAQASTVSSIGGGGATTISFQFGSISGGTLAGGVYSGASFSADPAQATTSLVIDSSNNSLQGIRDAINRAGLGVKAAIVNDGAPGTPYHLTLTSTATGAASAMKITASGANADPAVAALLGYDPAGSQGFTQTVAAQNASLNIDGQPISSATNAVTDAISGVTLNLAKTGTSTLSLSNNTAPVADAVNALVKAFNDTNSTLKKMTAYDPVNKTGGLLHGDSTIIALQAKLRSTLATALSGTGDNKLTNLTQLGVAFQKDGTLAVNSAKLQTALTDNFSDFASLFTAAGKTTDSLVSFAGSSASSTPGSYDINVTRLATRGSAAGLTRPNGLAGSVAANLTIDATNNQLQVDVDGAGPVAVTLTAGAPYASAAALAAQVEVDINGALTTAGQAGRVTVTESGGKLTIKSAAASATSSLSVTEDPGAPGNTGAASLLGTPAKLSTIVAGVNDQLTVSISGTTSTITLAAGSYTGDTLAQQVQAAINSDATFQQASIAVSASSANGSLTVTSTRYGSTSAINITGGSAFASLFSGSASSTPGVDVAGTINGVAATGSGQFLTGAADQPAAGVKLQVVGGAIGARGKVNFSQGYAYLLNNALDSMLSSTGALASNTDNANRNIADLHKRADTLTVQLTAMEKRYRAQYTALDSMLTNMNQTSQFLTQQLASLSPG
jgi:flagellar hook-associated protein 2